MTTPAPTPSVINPTVANQDAMAACLNIPIVGSTNGR